jgi:hypothetical protein
MPSAKFYKKIHAQLTAIQGGAFEHLGVIISEIAYEVISPLTAWVNTIFPGQSPSVKEGCRIAAQISAYKHR